MGDRYDEQSILVGFIPANWWSLANRKERLALSRTVGSENDEDLLPDKVEQNQTPDT